MKRIATFDGVLGHQELQSNTCKVRIKYIITNKTNKKNKEKPLTIARGLIQP
jgi:hypothetical protein